MSKVSTHVSGECRDFLLKQKILSGFYDKVTAKEMYADVFPPEMIERNGCQDDAFSNPIIAYTDRSDPAPDGSYRSFIRNEIVFRDFKAFDHAQKNPFAVCSMCSYSGRKRTAKNAYKMHGICIDLDGVGERELYTLISLYDTFDDIPRPTYLINSGHGVHVVYVFENPVPLYPKLIDYLQMLKRGLTEIVWTRETSTIKPADRQYQGIYQGYRIPGSYSKLGSGKSKDKYRVTAYRSGRKVTLEQLNRYVYDKYKMPITMDYASYEWADEDRLTIDKAQRLYPEWYEKRIIKKMPPGQYVCNHGLYDWWLRRIQEDGAAKDGNRYNCISVLFIMAIKCNISKEFAMQDALDLVEPFNELTRNDNNEFTIEDVKKASKYYAPTYSRYSINAIEARTGIRIERRKKAKMRLSQKDHIRIRVSPMRDALYPDGSWRNKNGAPTKSKQVEEWQRLHPGGRKTDCIRETGLSKPTVYKWWQER